MFLLFEQKHLKQVPQVKFDVLVRAFHLFQHFFQLFPTFLFNKQHSIYHLSTTQCQAMK